MPPRAQFSEYLQNAPIRKMASAHCSSTVPTGQPQEDAIMGIRALQDINVLRISLLHLALGPGELEYNQELVELGMRTAARLNSDWVITPELCITGYQFAERIGTCWIEQYPDEVVKRFTILARSLRMLTFLGHVERDSLGKLYNTAFVIGQDGTIIACHRKINVVAERWSSRGITVTPFEWGGLRIGMLVCADAYTEDIAGTLRALGCELLVSLAAWGPGLNGPAGEWEQRTIETGLPLIVCNRTGKELSLDFSEAESLVMRNGRRLLSHRSPSSAVLTFDWSTRRMLPTSSEFQVTEF
jgi:predicted amidohydrolase